MSSTKTPTAVVTIPLATATHVLGDSAVELAQGDLTVVITESSDVEAPTALASHGLEAETPVLTLTVGKAAFPLFRTTIFGTLADDNRAYLFTPEIGGESGGYVKIMLPSAIEKEGSLLLKLQTQFEEVLIKYGLLKAGLEAAANEIGQGVREDSAVIAQRIRDSTASYLDHNPPTDDPTAVSDAVHSISSGTAASTQAVADVAHTISSSVSSAASQAGAWISTNLAPATEAHAAPLEAYHMTAAGVSAGSSEVHAALADAVGQRVQNEYGFEARNVATNMGDSAGSIGSVLADTAAVGSGATFASSSLQGATEAQRLQHDGTTSIANTESPNATWKEVTL